MDMTKLFDSASTAFERGNWELAIMLFQQLLAMQPDHLDARRLLREAESRRWLQEGGGTFARVMALVKSIGALVSFAVHMLAKNYDRAIIDTEKVLARDPNCLPVLWGLAMAAMKGGHTDVAIVTLEQIRERQPKSTRPHRMLGLLYEEKGQIAAAIEAWQNVKKISPDDRDAQIKLRDLAATKTMVDGRYETATQKDATYRASLKSKEQAEEIEQEHRIIRTDEDLQQAIERVSRDVEQNPGQKRYIIQLGDLYRRAKEYAKARELYEQARKIDQMDYSILERLGELRIDEYAEEEAALVRKLESEPNDEQLKAKLTALRKEKFAYELEEYQRQVRVRPTDAGLRAKLGDLFFSSKRFDEAAPEYQKAAGDPRLRRRCRKMLGLCLFNTQKYQLAASQFEQAIEGGTPANREVREIMYYLAATLEKLDDLDRAEEVLRKIFDADMSYRDVQQRLDRIMQMKHERRQAKGQEEP